MTTIPLFFKPSLQQAIALAQLADVLELQQDVPRPRNLQRLFEREGIRLPPTKGDPRVCVIAAKVDYNRKP